MKKAKIQKYNSECVALATIDGADAFVRIPVNVNRPVPGSEIPVKKYRTETILTPEKKTVEVQIWIFVSDLSGK